MLARGDDFPHERLARDHADQPTVLLDDEHCSHVLAFGEVPSGILRAVTDSKRRWLRHHRIADGLIAHG